MAIKEMLRCGQCGQRAEADAMRWDESRQINLCANCKSGQKASKIEPRVKSQLISRALGDDMEAKPENKTKYKCEACSYTFTRGSSYDGKTCPYCSKKGSVHVREEAGSSEI